MRGRKASIICCCSRSSGLFLFSALRVAACWRVGGQLLCCDFFCCRVAAPLCPACLLQVSRTSMGVSLKSVLVCSLDIGRCCSSVRGTLIGRLPHERHSQNIRFSEHM